MNNEPNNRHFIVRFFNEIALYSGQYALFYIIMQFSAEKSQYWFNAGHVALLLALIIQTTALIYYGDKIFPRIILSFISLLVYTIFEFMEGGLNYSLLHTGHLCFWFYTLVFAALQYITHVSKCQSIRMLVEFLESNLNMFIFIFIYFFFDFNLTLQKQVALGTISPDFAKDQLLIWHFIERIGTLFKDPAHIYILIGTFFLSLTIAYSRIKILLLSEKIDSLLVRYIGEETRDELVRRNTDIISKRIETVILFCDIRNFTYLSEKSDPTILVEMLNFYYEKWHKTIKAFHGTINKFIGDAFLSFFDTQKTLSKNIELAVTASLFMLKQLENMNIELKEKGLPSIEGFGIGIHCGEVVLGDIGGERKDYTLIGDTVNTAARLEALCKTYNTAMIISDDCYQLLTDAMKKKFSNISSITLKGKAEMVTIYALNQFTDKKNNL